MSVHLARGGPYAVRVLSPLGAPLANARVEYYVYGCPHSPAEETVEYALAAA